MYKICCDLLVSAKKTNMKQVRNKGTVKVVMQI